jgi:hypothetical protein
MIGEGVRVVAGVRRQSARVAGVALLGMLCFAFLAPPANAGGPGRARSARTLSLKETGHLRLTSKRGFTLNEQGAASGTIGGTIYIHLHLASSSRVSAEVNIYAHGGSLSGHGSASYQVRGAFAAFSGSLAVTRGTGSYSRARASALRFTGAILRRNDSVTVQLSGSLSV